MGSSFTSATFRPVLVRDPKTGIEQLKTKEGRRLYSIHGDDGNGLTFHVGFEGSGLSVHVPEGFVTDGPSIPSWCRWLVPKTAREQAMKSAAVHDLLCEHPAFSRPEADVHFLIAMYAERTPQFWREVFFAAVRTNSSKAIEDENRQLYLDLRPGPKP
jgi:hypothetical protein